MGKYYRSEEDHNGVYGSWWVKRKWLVEQRGQEEVDEAFRQFKEDAEASSDEDDAN